MKNTPTHRINTLGGLAALLAALAMTFVAAPAWACGGFFCFTQPIDQSAERILYIQEDGKMTAHIQISYTGEDDKFSWILPLPSIPELGVGSDEIFRVLEQETAPRFQLEWKNTATCNGYSGCQQLDTATGGGGGGGGGGENSVEVLKQGNVGPYDFVVLKSNSATELIDWLNKNKYVQPAESKPLIDAYVKKEHVFLALKLAKDSAAGDITPVVVTLDESSPCLPIRLTSIAAQPDMPIVAWSLGKARAIPKNFLHVVLNEATLDWMRPGANYKTVVSKAVDQASGHAFTTEFAKPTSTWKRKFAAKNWDTNALKTITDPSKFLQKVLMEGYPRTSQMQQLIRNFIPKPDKYKDVKDQEFYNCLGSEWNNQKPCSDYKAAAKAQKFEPGKFADQLLKYVVEPLQNMDQAIKTHSYMTRLYTTLDAQEMDKDPIFAFNKTLPEVSHLHKATAHPICEGSSKQAVKAKLEFADGNQITVEIPKNNDNCQWNFGGGAVAFGKGTDPIIKAGGQPAMKIQVLDEKGAPLDIHPLDVDKVDARLNKAVAGQTSLDDAFKKSLLKPVWSYRDPKFDPNKGGASGGNTSGASSSGGSSSSSSSGGGASSGGASSGGASSGGASSGGASSGADANSGDGTGQPATSSCSAAPTPTSSWPAVLLVFCAAFGLLIRRQTV